MAKLSPDEALRRLIDGNRRFVEGNFSEKYLILRRRELVKGQNPIAVVITCADSRVSPEYIFDQGLGDIFVVRVAGNVVGAFEIASAEYSVSQLETPLIFVLGHEDCGAVKCSFDSVTDKNSYISYLVEEIQPSVIPFKEKSLSFQDALYYSIVENAKRTASKLLEKSKIISEKVINGDLKVVAGIYQITTGKVEILTD